MRKKGRMKKREWHSDPEISRYLTLIGQTGLYMAGCIVISVLIGIWLDYKTGLSPLFLATFCLVGIFSGFWGVYKLITKFYKTEKHQERK